MDGNPIVVSYFFQCISSVNLKTLYIEITFTYFVVTMCMIEWELHFSFKHLNIVLK